MTDHSYAEIFEVFRCKALQQVGSDGILAKRRLILLEAKLAQPVRNVHYYPQEGRLSYVESMADQAGTVQALSYCAATRMRPSVSWQIFWQPSQAGRYIQGPVQIVPPGRSHGRACVEVLDEPGITVCRRCASSAKTASTRHPLVLDMPIFTLRQPSRFV
jgi:hypothetical protein